MWVNSTDYRVIQLKREITEITEKLERLSKRDDCAHAEDEWTELTGLCDEVVARLKEAK